MMVVKEVNKKKVLRCKEGKNWTVMKTEKSGYSVMDQQ